MTREMIDEISRLNRIIADLREAGDLAARAIRMVINNRPENESAPTNMGLASVEERIRAAIKQATP